MEPIDPPVAADVPPVKDGMPPEATVVPPAQDGVPPDTEVDPPGAVTPLVVPPIPGSELEPTSSVSPPDGPVVPPVRDEPPAAVPVPIPLPQAAIKNELEPRRARPTERFSMAVFPMVVDDETRTVLSRIVAGGFSPLLPQPARTTVPRKRTTCNLASLRIRFGVSITQGLLFQQCREWLKQATRRFTVAKNSRVRRIFALGRVSICNGSAAGKEQK